MEYVAHSFNCRIENADFAEMLFREMSIIDVTNEQRDKERQCADTIYWDYWHCAGSLGWPFPMLKYKYSFQTK